MKKIILLAALLAACSDSDTTGIVARVDDVRVTQNSQNALSTIVTFNFDGDSARVRYWSAQTDTVETPCYSSANHEYEVALVGLRASTQYSHQVVGCGSSVVSSPVQLTTGSLPEGLAALRFEVKQRGSLPGMLLLNATLQGRSYALAFDSTGELRWYREFSGYEGVPTGETKQQPNGHLTTFLGSTSGFNPTYGRYVEYPAGGDIVATYAAPAPLYTDNHELLLTDEGGRTIAHFFAYDLRAVDLSEVGGRPDGLVAGHYVLRMNDAATDFVWSAWDHFPLQEWIEPNLPAVSASPTDFDHPNSLAFDRDGNYIVSFRHFGEIVKLDRRTGAIMWRFGGVSNQFRIIGDPLGFFSGQHSVSILPNGNVLIYDNGIRHTPPETRVVEYQLDTQAKTATMVWEYRHVPAIYTPFLGFTQRLKNGNTFVAFGGVGVVVVVDPQKNVLWEGTLRNGANVVAFYRARPVPSLYEYQTP